MPQQNQQQGQPQQAQPNVRVIPIFVEGRDQPVINRDLPDSSSSGSIPEMGQIPRQEMPRMSQPTMDFGNDMPSFTHGSLFDRAKDFPVRRSFPTAQEFFNRGASPSRESPLRQVPINHMNEPAFSPFQAAPQQPQQQQQYMPPRRQQPSPTQAPFAPNMQPRSRTSSRNSEEPPMQQPEPRQVPVHHQSPSPQQPQQQQQHEQQQEPEVPQRAPSEEPKPQPIREGPIEKIQRIQKNVLDLMTQVEQFNGKTRKDKEYIYLDEMLTQNLIRLDDVETQGKENVKMARKEAVKCINRCLSVLEAKAEAAEQQLREFGNQLTSPEQMDTSDTNGCIPENTQNESNIDVDPPSNEPPSKSSRSSIYDNHDPNAVSSQSSMPRSKEPTPQPMAEQHTSNSVRGSKENSPSTNNSMDTMHKEQSPPFVAPQKSGSGSSQK